MKKYTLINLIIITILSFFISCSKKGKVESDIKKILVEKKIENKVRYSISEDNKTVTVILSGDLESIEESEKLAKEITSTTDQGFILVSNQINVKTSCDKWIGTIEGEKILYGMEALLQKNQKIKLKIYKNYTYFTIYEEYFDGMMVTYKDEYNAICRGDYLEITRIVNQDPSGNRSMLIKFTDDEIITKEDSQLFGKGSFTITKQLENN